MCKSKDLILCRSDLTSQKVTTEIVNNPVQTVTGSEVCVQLCLLLFCVFVFFMCMHNELEKEEREREREMQNIKKLSVLINKVKVYPVPASTAFFFPPPRFPTFEASIFSFNLIIVNKCRRKGRWDSAVACPLSPIGSVDIFKQELIKGLHPCRRTD